MSQDFDYELMTILELKETSYNRLEGWSRF